MRRQAMRNVVLSLCNRTDTQMTINVSVYDLACAKDDALPPHLPIASSRIHPPCGQGTVVVSESVSKAPGRSGRYARK
ncbi:hypothetical protein K438DRAFT_1845196, partial [Mycena galopus ATCC 62051]